MENKLKIRKYLEQRIKSDHLLSDSDDVFELGLFNSMFSLQLVMFIEREFEIKIEGDDLDTSNFNSIENINRFILSKKV